MLSTQEIKNKNEIATFLESNGIELCKAMGYNKFETAYYINNDRKFFEETPIIFNIIGDTDIHITLPEINDIEFKTTFKITEENFAFNEENDTLTITGEDEYKIIINSIYLDI